MNCEHKWKKKNYFRNQKQKQEQEEGTGVRLLSELRLFSEQSGLVLRVTVSWRIFLIRKSLESPRITFQREAFEGYVISNGCFLKGFHLWALKHRSKPTIRPWLGIKISLRWTGSWSRWRGKATEEPLLMQMFSCRSTKEQREAVLSEAAGKVGVGLTSYLICRVGTCLDA